MAFTRTNDAIPCLALAREIASTAIWKGGKVYLERMMPPWRAIWALEVVSLVAARDFDVTVRGERLPEFNIDLIVQALLLAAAEMETRDRQPANEPQGDNNGSQGARL